VSRYRFRLEQVLRVRRAEEEVARQALQRANRALHNALAVHQEHVERYLHLARSLGPMPLDAFHQEQISATLAAATVAASEVRLAEIQAETDRHRDAWFGAAQRVQALERLDERRRQEHIADEYLKEIATVDDLVAARWISPLELAKEEARR